MYVFHLRGECGSCTKLLVWTSYNLFCIWVTLKVYIEQYQTFNATYLPWSLNLTLFEIDCFVILKYSLCQNYTPSAPICQAFGLNTEFLQYPALTFTKSHQKTLKTSMFSPACLINLIIFTLTIISVTLRAKMSHFN